MFRGPIKKEVDSRRLEDTIIAIEKRKIPYSFKIVVNLGASASSGVFSIPGLNWITDSHSMLIGLTSVSQATSDIRFAVTKINKGVSAEVSWRSQSPIGGEQALMVLAI